MILGIDPGVAAVGFALLDIVKGSPKLEDCGVIKTPAGMPLAERLLLIQKELIEIISGRKIEQAAVEQILFNTNVTTGIQVAHARGVIICTLAAAKIKVFEYAPPQVKKAVTGRGNAGKADVQEMVRRLLGLKKIIRPDDAADAAALALCHSHRAEIHNV